MNRRTAPVIRRYSDPRTPFRGGRKGRTKAQPVIVWQTTDPRNVAVGTASQSREIVKRVRDSLT